MSVTVLTAIYGAYDDLKLPVPQTVDAEWICVTDNPDVRVGPWRIVHEENRGVHPRLAAKVPKCLPQAYTTSDITVWVDGSCVFKQPNTLARLIESLQGGPIAQFDHPDRKCIYAEGEYSAFLPKYIETDIGRQLVHYRVNGHPQDWGLWATGVIVRDHAAMEGGECLDAFGYRWLAEQVRWSIQDQVSEAPALRSFGLRPTSIPGNLWNNDLVGWGGHAHGL